MSDSGWQQPRNRGYRSRGSGRGGGGNRNDYGGNRNDQRNDNQRRDGRDNRYNNNYNNNNRRDERRQRGGRGGGGYNNMNQNRNQRYMTNRGGNSSGSSNRGGGRGGRGGGNNNRPFLGNDETEIWNILMAVKLGETFTSPEEHYIFEEELNNIKRKYVHMNGKKMGLITKSFGVGVNRRLHVWRETAVDQKHETKVQSMQISPNAADLIRRYRANTQHDVERRQREDFLKSGRGATQTHQESKKRKLHRANEYFAFDISRNDQALSMAMQARWRDTQNTSHFQSLLATRRKLPVFQHHDSILRLLQSNRVLILSGGTGTGKTTQVPQFILEELINAGRGSQANVVITQPRKLSASSVARRVSTERCCSLGSEVGYHVRLDCKMSRDSRIKYLTVGILLKHITSNRNLEGVSHLIIDEVHERDSLTDFLLIATRDLILHNPHIKVVLMSATINAHVFYDYFTETLPESMVCQYEIKSKHFHVEVEYLEDLLEQLPHYRPPQSNINHQISPTEAVESFLKENAKYYQLGNAQQHNSNRSVMEMDESKEPDSDDDTDAQIAKPVVRDPKLYSAQTIHAMVQMTHVMAVDARLVAECVFHILNKLCPRKPGALLIFCSGWKDIEDIMNAVTFHQEYGRHRIQLLPLHSKIADKDQQQVMITPPNGVHKIVISTNIAETSITIPDVVYVIDTGYVKSDSFDAFSKVETLCLDLIAKSSADQRKGRAGRLRPGHCFRLYTLAQYDAFQSFPIPGLLRTPLDQCCLQTKLLNYGRVSEFLAKAIDPPESKTLDAALHFLKEIDAMDEDENLTVLGHRLAILPMNPRLGKMLLYGYVFQCIEPVALVCAALSGREIFTPLMGYDARTIKERRMELAEHHADDMMIFLNALIGFQAADNRANAWIPLPRRMQQFRDGRSYCRFYGIAWNAITFALKIKNQVLRMLMQSMDKHLDAYNHKDSAARMNRNSGNKALVSAVVQAGLYPNVARLMHPEDVRQQMSRQFKKICYFESLVNEAGMKFQIPTNSINHPSHAFRYVYAKTTNREEPVYCVFHSAQRAHSSFLRNTAVVTPLVLILMCNNPYSVVATKLTKQQAKEHAMSIQQKSAMDQQMEQDDAYKNARLLERGQFGGGSGNVTNLAALSAAVSSSTPAYTSHQYDNIPSIPSPSSSTVAEPLTIASMSVSAQSQANVVHMNDDDDEEEDFSAFKEVDLDSLMQDVQITPPPTTTTATTVASIEDEVDDAGFVDANEFGEVDLDALMSDVKASASSSSSATVAAASPQIVPFEEQQDVEDGDNTWTCEQCTMKNEASLTECSVCSFKRPLAHGVWACEACTFENENSLLQCSVCGYPCPGLNNLPQQQQQQQATSVDHKSSSSPASQQHLQDDGESVVLFHVNQAIKFSHDRNRGGDDLMQLRSDVDWLLMRNVAMKAKPSTKGNVYLDDEVDGLSRATVDVIANLFAMEHENRIRM